MTPDTPFWIASMTKPITATAILVLQRRGQTQWDTSGLVGAGGPAAQKAGGSRNLAAEHRLLQQERIAAFPRIHR